VTGNKAGTGPPIHLSRKQVTSVAAGEAPSHLSPGFIRAEYLPASTRIGAHEASSKRRVGGQNDPRGDEREGGPGEAVKERNGPLWEGVDQETKTRRCRWLCADNLYLCPFMTYHRTRRESGTGGQAVDFPDNCGSLNVQGREPGPSIKFCCHGRSMVLTVGQSVTW